MGTKSDEMKDRSPEEIRHDMEQTRNRMSGTIDEIQYRLQPDRLKQRAKDTVRENTIGKVQQATDGAAQKAKGVSSDMFDTIKKNPVPAALVAVGLGWLFMERKNAGPDDQRRFDYRYDYGTERGARFYGERSYEGSESGRYYQGRPGYQGAYEYGMPQQGMRERMGSKAGDVKDKMSDAAGSVGDKVSDAASAVSDKVSGAASNVGDKVSNAASNVGDTMSNVADEAQYRAQRMADQARYGAQKARTRLDDLMDSNPLILGAAALAVGAAIGLSLPSTQKEQELFGETRDQLMEKAQSKFEETKDKAQRVAEATLDTAKDKARETMDTAKEEARNQDLAK